MTRNKVITLINSAASVSLTLSFFLESLVNPGKLDTLNALSWALVLLAIWFMPERTK